MSEEFKQEAVQEQAACCAELGQIKEKYAYLLADFENHRRREAQERIVRFTVAQASILQDLLPLVDDFERALQDAQKNQSLVGFELIQKNLLKLLEKHGVTEVKAEGMLDPQIHEVLMQVPQEGAQSGEIIAVLRKGYMHKGQVLRPAQVSVAA